ncbi:MAG: glycosyltransferase family 39 protein, partial [Chloroflexi bacterium]|nr:glycosyltransferase family 39 protein [Chloroflexota bacterium]
MRTKLFPLITLLFVGFTAGAILGRRWRGEVADTVLTFAVLATGVLLIFIAANYLRASSLPTSYLSASFRDGKWVLRLQAVGRLQFFELAIALPHGWSARPTEATVPHVRGFVLNRTEAFAVVLFALSLAVYAVTRLVALDQFPIYFFADEAIEGVLASQLIQRGWRDYQDKLLPLFFNTYGFFNPLISVYFHAAGLLLFGKSIVVTRGVSAVMTLVGAAAVGLILKSGFRVRYWWAGVLFLAATPVWFLHSRTAFETAMMVSFYACFLLCYVLYRYRSPRFIFPALVFAAATFYSYGNGQLVIGLTGLLLLFSDLRYHLRNWRTALLGAILLVVLALPYVQFGRDRPTEAAYHLRTLNTYLMQQIPLEQKLVQFLGQYVYGFSPQYWFVPNENDLARHRMKDYGNIALWALPFFLIGVGICLRRIKSSAHRLALIAALAAPIGGAITQVAITRILTFVVPASIFATLGLDFLLARLRPRWRSVATAIVFVGISGASLGMLSDALSNGPLWYRDYGLYGMQWGAKQLFEVIPRYVRQSPDTVVNVTPTWANGTDVFLDYFMPKEPRVKFANVDALIAERQPLSPNMV